MAQAAATPITTGTTVRYPGFNHTGIVLSIADGKAAVRWDHNKTTTVKAGLLKAVDAPKTGYVISADALSAAAVVDTRPVIEAAPAAAPKKGRGKKAAPKPEYPAGQKFDFDTWMKKVDAALVKKCGVGYEDLPDRCWDDMYEDGYTPAEAAKEAIEEDADY